jgi:N-acetylneuraminate synthase
LSANHNRDLSRAIAIVDAAADAKVDAVKLQTYTADTLTIDSDRADFRIETGPWAGQNLYQLYQTASTPWEWHEALFKHARTRGLTVFSSAFDRHAVDMLIELGVPAFKIASFELVDLPLIEYAAGFGKPMLLSTGLASATEIEAAVATVRRAGCEQVALLYCISAYPTPIGEANLATIMDMRQRFGVEIGLSDHTLGHTASVAAVVLGATLIEKHLTLRRSDGGPDAAFSLEPEEFAQLVASCRDARLAVGEVSYQRKPSEEANLRFRRSLYVTRDVAKGEAFTESNVRSIRPSFGLPPKFLPTIVGRHATRPVIAGEPLQWDMIEGGSSLKTGTGR